MKKIMAFIICALMLCGCGRMESGIDHAISFRQKLLSDDQCRFECTITADYGDILHSFVLNCEFDDKGTLAFQVLEPEGISGITGTIRSEGGELTFDGNALAFPLLADGYISPISAPWVFMKALRSGYMDSCGKTDEGFLLLINDSYEETPLQLEVYMDKNYLPLRAEMIWQGRRILSLDVNNFSCV